jgi:uncharacterized protein HemX
MTEMNKGVLILLIAIGVFLGVFAYEKFTEYRFNRELAAIQQRESQKAEARRNEREERARNAKAKEDYKNTACAINENTKSCSCIDKRNGAKIVLAKPECEKRAREITW